MSFICIYIFPVAPWVRGTKTVALYTVTSALNLYPMHSGPLLCQRWTSCQEFTQVEVLIDFDVHIHLSPLVSVPPLASCISFKSFMWFWYLKYVLQVPELWWVSYIHLFNYCWDLKKKGKGKPLGDYWDGCLLWWRGVVLSMVLIIAEGDISKDSSDPEDPGKTVPVQRGKKLLLLPYKP